jgi:hypothetical protein
MDKMIELSSTKLRPKIPFLVEFRHSEFIWPEIAGRAIKQIHS